MRRTINLTGITFRPARPGDQEAIGRLVKSERLNPTGLHWPNFIIACDDEALIGAVQLRKHPDGSRELGSLVVVPVWRGLGVAAHMIDALLAFQTEPVEMITQSKHAWHYEQWGFAPIAPERASHAVRQNYRLGRMARVISFVKRLPLRQLVILERPAQALPAHRSTNSQWAVSDLELNAENS